MPTVGAGWGLFGAKLVAVSQSTTGTIFVDESFFGFERQPGRKLRIKTRFIMGVFFKTYHLNLNLLRLKPQRLRLLAGVANATGRGLRRGRVAFGSYAAAR